MSSQLRDSDLLQRIWTVVGGVSIRIKVLGIVLGTVVLLGGFVTLQMRSVLYETLSHELEQQGFALTALLVEQTHSLLENGQISDMPTFLAERQAHYSSSTHNTLVEYILLANPDGTILASTYDAAVPDAVQAVSLPARPIHDQVTHVTTATNSVLDIARTLEDDDAVIRLGLAETNIRTTVDQVTLQLVSITLVMIVAGFGAAIFLTWILTRPILDLVHATQAVAQGDFTHHVDRWANDEIGDLADAFNDMIGTLASADEARAQYISGVISAQEEERKRIARELHDSTSQALTSLLVGLRNLESSAEPAAAAQPSPNGVPERLHEMREIVNATLEEVHSLAWQLRPTLLDDLGLLVALQRYTADYQRRQGIQVDFVPHGLTERLSSEMETTIYRIVQEALTNVARHAYASQASVLIEQHGAVIHIIVEDDGIGFDLNNVHVREQSLGLQGIRERARLFQGELIIETQPEHGTTLFVRLPLTHAAPPTTQGDGHGSY